MTKQDIRMIVDMVVPNCKVTFGRGEGCYCRPSFLNAPQVINIDFEQLRKIWRGGKGFGKFKKNLKLRGFDMSSFSTMVKGVTLHEVAHARQHEEWPLEMFESITRQFGEVTAYCEVVADRYARIIGRQI